MRTNGWIAAAAVLGLFAAAAPADAAPREGIGQRDYHYRLSPNPHPQYRYYPAPKTYYPRRAQDRPVLPQPPRSNMRDPAGPQAPSYGMPPPAIERIPPT